VTKPNPQNYKNCSSKSAYNCAQLQYTIQHRTVQIIFPLTSKHHSSDAVTLGSQKNDPSLADNVDDDTIVCRKFLWLSSETICLL